LLDTEKYIPTPVSKIADYLVEAIDDALGIADAETIV
jgi:hypothetical protein